MYPYIYISVNHIAEHIDPTTTTRTTSSTITLQVSLLLVPVTVDRLQITL